MNGSNGLRRKKMQFREASFMVQGENMGADMFIWIDETGSDKCTTSRKYVYSVCGVTPLNCCLYIPGKRISATSAILTRGVDVYLAEGGVSDDTFCDFIVKVLLPVLQPFNGFNPRSNVTLIVQIHISTFIKHFHLSHKITVNNAFIMQGTN